MSMYSLHVPSGCAQVSAKQRRGRVNEILELMGLAHCEKTRASSLSGGERRRLGALSLSPRDARPPVRLRSFIAPAVSEPHPQSKSKSEPCALWFTCLELVSSRLSPREHYATFEVSLLSSRTLTCSHSS